MNEIILPASVKTIGDNAFGQNVQWGDISVYIYAEVPPEGNGNIPQRNELKIYVPEKSVEMYKKTVLFFINSRIINCLLQRVVI